MTTGKTPQNSAEKRMTSVSCLETRSMTPMSRSVTPCVYTGRGGRWKRRRRQSAERWINADLAATDAAPLGTLPRHALRRLRLWVVDGEVG